MGDARPSPVGVLRVEGEGAVVAGDVGDVDRDPKESRGAPPAFAVTLLSPDLEFASSEDLLLRGAELGHTYDLLVMSDVFGYVWSHQLDRRVGRAPEILADLVALRRGGPTHHGPAGPPITERRDPRWRFRVHELARLWALGADCTCWLVDEA